MSLTVRSSAAAAPDDSDNRRCSAGNPTVRSSSPKPSAICGHHSRSRRAQTIGPPFAEHGLHEDWSGDNSVKQLEKSRAAANFTRRSADQLILQATNSTKLAPRTTKAFRRSAESSFDKRAGRSDSPIMVMPKKRVRDDLASGSLLSASLRGTPRRKGYRRAGAAGESIERRCQSRRIVSLAFPRAHRPRWASVQREGRGEDEGE